MLAHFILLIKLALSELVEMNISPNLNHHIEADLLDAYVSGVAVMKMPTTKEKGNSSSQRE